MRRRPLTWAAVRPRATCTGTVSRPSFCAARRRVWPAMMTPASSTTIGCRQPYSPMESATFSTAASLMTRGFAS